MGYTRPASTRAVLLHSAYPGLRGLALGYTLTPRVRGSTNEPSRVKLTKEYIAK